MVTLTVTRKKKFASAVMPYWIITCMSKSESCSRYGLNGDWCEQSDSGFPVTRIDINVLDKTGTRIQNGQTVSLELQDGDESLFVSTMDGYLSNEIKLSDLRAKDVKIVITTKGGFADLPHPVVEVQT